MQITTTRCRRDKARLALDPNPSSVVQFIQRRMIMSKEWFMRRTL